MLRSQKLEIKSVEIRGRLSELAGLDSLEEDQRTELKEKTAELRQVEEQRVASLEIETLESEQAEKSTNGTNPDPEERERQEILGKARLGNALRAVMDGRPLQGAENELRSAYGLSGDHEIPHELFEPREAKDQRAATDAPATGTQVNEQPVQPFIYKEGVAGFLGIDMPQVGGGNSFSSCAHHRDACRDEGEGGGSRRDRSCFHNLDEHSEEGHRVLPGPCGGYGSLPSTRGFPPEGYPAESEQRGRGAAPQW